MLRNELNIGQNIEIERITGSTMTVQIQKEVMFGDYKAIIPRVSGDAWIHGFSEFYFDENDIFENVFWLN